jgi:phage terminase large subunit GpA-like protein
MAALTSAAKSARARALLQFMPPERMATVAWAEQYRHLPKAGGALPGQFRFSITPYLRGILGAYDDPAVHTIVCRKSAQVGWTDGVLVNILGKHIHQDPCPIVILFPKSGTAKDFTREKLNPTIEASPELAKRIDTRTRGSDNTLEFKSFPGGFIKLAGSNSPANIKSTPARVVGVEEPDDVNRDVKGQGSAIALGKERNKTFWNRKTIIGGTPTIKGFSEIDSEMEASDQRRFYVPCHGCNAAHPLSWEHVVWSSDSLTHHPVYGTHQVDTARYACPGCGLLWTDAEKNANVSRAEGAGHGWRATAPFHGVAGFYLNELYSSMPASRLALLVEKWLRAQYSKKQGDLGPLKAFVNSTLGEPWELRNELPDVKVLEERALDYAEFTVPSPALVATAGVDVQHDRLAVIIRAWGRAEESWLVFWGELPGNPLERDVWVKLDELLGRQIRNAGGVLTVSAASIDSGDGLTADAVYGYVRARRGRHFMAIKGSSQPGREIFRPPLQSVDTTYTAKASRYGLKPYIVGVSRAKDTIHGRLKLPGDGPMRFHWYRSVREDYLAQLTSEVKFARRGAHEAWQLKAGARNEALDGEVYALHAARRLRLHTLSEGEWARHEARVRQPDLLPIGPAAVSQAKAADPAPTPARTPTGRSGGGDSFSW